MLATDSRSSWNWTGGVIEDNRVTHYWDDKKKVGRFYADKNPESDDPEVIWDAFYLYGPDAQWLQKPEPLLATGATVRSEFDTLRDRTLPLLKN
jgi:hypothetical protein